VEQEMATVAPAKSSCGKGSALMEKVTRRNKKKLGLHAAVLDTLLLTEVN